MAVPYYTVDLFCTVLFLILVGAQDKPDEYCRHLSLSQLIILRTVCIVYSKELMFQCDITSYLIAEFQKHGLFSNFTKNSVYLLDEHFTISFTLELSDCYAHIHSPVVLGVFFNFPF